MPTSYPENISTITCTIQALNGRSFLDVGPGYGKFGFLIRERVDNFEGNIRLDAVEVFKGYNEKASRASKHPAAHDLYACIYDNYAYGEFVKLAQFWLQEEQTGTRPEGWPQRVDAYDVVLMIDVLEHWTDVQASHALALALELGRTVLISTPVGYPQGPSEGNDREAHLSDWPHEKLRQWAAENGARWSPVTRGCRTDDSVIGLMRRAPRGRFDLTRLRRLHPRPERASALAPAAIATG